MCCLKRAPASVANMHCKSFTVHQCFGGGTAYQGQPAVGSPKAQVCPHTPRNELCHFLMLKCASYYSPIACAEFGMLERSSADGLIEICEFLMTIGVVSLVQAVLLRQIPDAHYSIKMPRPLRLQSRRNLIDVADFEALRGTFES